ncbi:Uma2 family endonuclease [Spirulina sp. 06S082]|uniref:Uma2 family endonuclease n=1 Tax=Spirulina sp. 06S082 TaxID=3110248 RepID=UPI002B1FF502|nr:Uma2 family endonuclease [Spirulina sp. 06S082]MEA5467701.1 Uma2 family endonuclease [Spirulina sp. 06S082]
MYAVISPQKTQIPPGTVVRIPGTWQDYKLLCESRGDSSIPRIKYCLGEILLMSPMAKHGREAHILARIVETLLDRENRDYEAFTPITIELPEEGGIEPDYCFYIDNWRSALGKDRINWQTDPPPDLAIEIDVTSYTSPEDYLPYCIPELWLLKRGNLQIYSLENESYIVRSRSRCFPGLDVIAIVTSTFQAAGDRGTGRAIRELRSRL